MANYDEANRHVPSATEQAGRLSIGPLQRRETESAHEAIEPRPRLYAYFLLGDHETLALAKRRPWRRTGSVAHGARPRSTGDRRCCQVVVVTSRLRWQPGCSAAGSRSIY